MKTLQVPNTIVLMTLTLTAGLTCANELLPDHWTENVVAADGSVQHSLVFRTVPGVSYRVESSGDLATWIKEEEIYGMGHELVVPMRQFTPPLPSPPGPNPVVLPPRPVASPTLLMRSSNETAGGTVVHWKSLDHGGPMAFLLEENLHPDWQEILLFSQRYGAFYFFVWHPSDSVAPPTTNPELGSSDAAMIAQLEESFGHMNQLVASSAAVARNTPPPAPVAPGAKKFWRIHADWSVDTDGDGSFDWLEFLAAADAGHPQRALANAFAADSNSDGVPDGSQLDFDKDGIPDSLDLMVNDGLIDWEKPPIPLYAAFAVPPHDSGLPLHINSQGMVLFPAAVRIDGQTFPLPMSGPQAVATRAIGMNDFGQILGVGFKLPPPSSGGGSSNAVAPEEILVWWNSKSDNGPTPVTDGEHDARDVCLKYLQAAEGVVPPDILASRFPWDRVLDNQGRFVATRDADVPGGLPIKKVWKRTGSGFAQVEETSAGALFTYTGESEGGDFSYGPSSTGTEIWIGGSLQSTIEGMVTRLTSLPSGRLAAVRGSFQRPLLDDGTGGWQASGLFPEALTDAGRLGSQPLRVGGRMVYMDLVRESPRPWSSVAPAAPAVAVEHLDGTYNGWLLSTQDETHAASLPVILKDGGFASGVDHVSVTSSAPGPACENRAWLLAPAGAGSPLNSFNLESAAGPNAKVTVSAENAPLATFADLAPGAPPSDGNLLLENPAVAAFVDGTGIDPQLSGSAIYPIFSLGEGAAFTTPVGIKVMKARTIRVKVWVIPKAFGAASIKQPAYTPLKQELDDYLSAIFEPQINAKFDCDIETVDPIAFESENGEDFGGGANSTWEEGSNSLDQYGEVGGEMDDVSGNHDASRSINVYLVGGVGGGQRVQWNPVAEAVEVEKDSRGKKATWNGTTDVPGRRCWVVGGSNDGTAPGITAELIRDTMAHEIGHVIVGSGHPDEGSGPAPLPDTPHVHRLMCSGLRRKIDGTSKLLVKAEWDEAERWMKIEEEADRIEP